MKAGDLVRIKRASIGVPMDTLGLLTAKEKVFGPEDNATLWDVQLLGVIGHPVRARRYMSRDLEVINASR